MNDENLKKGVKITPETAREYQKKSVDAHYFRKQMMELFKKSSGKAFQAVIDKAVNGDTAALEQVRKWIGADADAPTTQNIILSVGSQAELESINKWTGD